MPKTIKSKKSRKPKIQSVAQKMRELTWKAEDEQKKMEELSGIEQAKLLKEYFQKVQPAIQKILKSIESAASTCARYFLFTQAHRSTLARQCFPDQQPVKLSTFTEAIICQLQAPPYDFEIDENDRLVPRGALFYIVWD